MSLAATKYDADRAWGDQFMPQVTQLVARNLVVPTPPRIDRNEAADLMLLSARPKRIAVRVRRHGYADRYPFDVTMRCERASGAETEVSKFLSGFGDWMFYGHADQAESKLERWVLLDLSIWRQALMREGLRGVMNLPMIYRGAIRMMSNGDGTKFAYFDVRDFPDEMILDTNIPELRHG
jgi:hypothetical protein